MSPYTAREEIAYVVENLRRIVEKLKDGSSALDPWRGSIVKKRQSDPKGTNECRKIKKTTMFCEKHGIFPIGLKLL